MKKAAAPAATSKPVAATVPPGPVPPTGEFTSAIPYTGDWGEELIIYCSDPRYREQTHDLLRHLGIVNPAVITIPAGVAPLLPLVGFAHELIKGLVDLLFSKHRPKRIVVVAHQECAGYGSAKHPILRLALQQATGRTVEDLQCKHLQEAKGTLRTWFPGVAVVTYFAQVKDGPDGSRQVVFTEVV